MENTITLHGSYKLPKIYANQWCSLWENHTIYEKMKRDGFLEADFNEENYQKELEEMQESGCINQMYASYYAVDDDLGLYRAYDCSYLDVEYYHGDKSGRNRLLLALAMHINNGLTLEELLKALSVIRNEERAKMSIDQLDATDTVLENLLIKKSED